MEWFSRNKGISIAAGVAAVIAIVVFSFASWVNSIHNEGWTKQRAVLQQYNTYQTSLSTCLDNSQVGAQIASQEYKQVKDVLTSIVSARYSDAGALNGSSGAFVSALQEQYPDIDRTLWKQLMTTAIGCRNQVADTNNELQSVAGRFDTWAHTGGIFERQFRSKFPNSDLVVIGLNGPMTGAAALTFLVTPITTGEATNAIRTHVMPEQDLFGNS